MVLNPGVDKLEHVWARRDKLSDLRSLTCSLDR